MIRMGYLRTGGWLLLIVALGLVAGLALTGTAAAQSPSHPGGGEASLKIPDLDRVHFGAFDGRQLLFSGLVVCVLGLLFGLVIYGQLRGLPVHASMRDISELIYETCKTYLITQGRFLLLLEAVIAVIIILSSGVLLGFERAQVAILVCFSRVGLR